MLPLETNRLFADLTDEELMPLKMAAQVRAYPAGDLVFHEGDEVDGIYVVITGEVHISAVVGNGRRKVLSKILPGDFFGEMAVLDHHPSPATASAEADTQLFLIPRRELLDALGSTPRLAVNLVRHLSQRMRGFNRQYIAEVLHAERLTLVGRVADSIVRYFKHPLDVIGLCAEMAAMDVATPAMRESAKNRIEEQVDRLSNMIGELLEFTRGSQNSPVLVETNYARYMIPLIEEIRGEIAVKNVSIVFENPPPEATLLLNPARLTHVFYSLIHNAVDAMMPDGGKVTLRFRRSDSAVVTEVEDSGTGISPEIAPLLFEAFATFGKAHGTGLGLSICKRIIQDHGGVILAASPPGRGAVFMFTLPIH